MVAIFFLTALVLMILGVPIAITVGSSSLLYIFLKGIEPSIMIQRLFAGVDIAPLLAIPLFILAGDLMNMGGLAKRLIRVANSVIGNSNGGLAIVTILGCMFFAAISGSGVATAAALGSIMIPAMVDKGYDRNFASAVVASASPIGVIIPPSISFIIYGVLTGTSITDLYKAGLPAGFIMGAFLIFVAYITSRRKGYRGENIPIQPSTILKALKDAAWALGTPVILIGGVFGGVFTPTESAVVGVVYALFVGIFIYKELKWSDIPKIVFGSAKMAAKIMFIIANASIFAWVLTYERIPQKIVEGFLAFSDNPIVILLIINLLLLIAGTFMETGAILIITVPLFMPIITHLGIDPVHFGIIVTVNTAIGLLTPPFGVCLFTTASVGKVSIQALSRRIIIPLIAMIVALLVITFIPQSIMFLL